MFLRLPAPAVASSVNEQLGLTTPEFQDVELSPVVFRKARPQVKKDGEFWELMISAISVDSVLGDSGATDASELFAGAAGVLVDDRLMEIESVSSSDMDGASYVYRAVLHVPQAKTI